jgi:hypothetical protein
MHTTPVSATSRTAASRTSTRRAVAAAAIALLSLAGSQIPATAHATPSSKGAAVVRPNWGHCSTPGVPC